MDQVNQAAQTPYCPVLYRAKVMVTQTSRPMRCKRHSSTLTIAANAPAYRESMELCTREKSVGIERGCVLQTDDKHLEANTNKEGAEVCGSFVGGFFAKSSKDFEGLATSGSHNKDGMRFKEAVYMAKRTHHFILRVR